MTHIPEQRGLAAALAPDFALVQQGVTWFADELRDRLAGEAPITETVLGAYTSILERGGKRMRGGLVVISHDMYGGDNLEVASRAAGIVEGIQANLLVLDDVSDRSDTRRGGPTAHVMIERGLRELGASGALGPIAMDMAVNTAVGVHSEIQILLGELDVPPERALAAIKLVNDRLIRTGVGQIMDVFSTTGVPMSEEDILKVAKYKTAHYSFELPFKLGALLAGGNDEEFPRIEQYSEAAGLAFQLRDDVMGVFGNEAQTGKPPESDIKEGKQTLLMYLAMRDATDTERSVLERALGNPDLTEEEFAACREILEHTGARSHTEGLAQNYADQAQAALADPPEFWKPTRVEQLRTITSFVVARSV